MRSMRSCSKQKLQKSSSKRIQKASTFTRMKRARVTTGPFSFKGATFLEFPAQGNAVSPRFGKELREDLAASWKLGIYKWW